MIERAFDEVKEGDGETVNELEAKEWLESIVYEDFAPYTQKAILKAIEALESQIVKSCEVSTDWIPVSERLPDTQRNVLTCDEKGNVYIFTHSGDYKYPFCIPPDHTKYFMPIAWMELPKKYKEK